MTIVRNIPVVIAYLLIGLSQVSFAEDPAMAPSSKAVEAIRLLQSADPYQRQLGFLRLEALREPATLSTIQGYLNHRDPDLRAYSVRALAAVEGVNAAPVLLEKLQTDRAPRVRRAALLGLEVFQKTQPELLPAFIKALRDHDMTVRMTAADVVSRVDDPTARAAIKLRYRREYRKDVRRVLEAAMKRMGLKS